MKMHMFSAIIFAGVIGSASAQGISEPSQMPNVILRPHSDTVAVQMLRHEDAEAAFRGSSAPLALAKPGLVLALKVGNEDIYTYACTQIEMPAALLDADGGTIRLVLQHELDPHDQVRVIDEHIALEWTDDTYGKRGRYAGRYGWTRQSGGGDAAWVLGDQVAHNLFAPWDWIWVDDFARFGNGQLLGGNKIQICVHPHVTARVFFYD